MFTIILLKPSLFLLLEECVYTAMGVISAYIFTELTILVNIYGLSTYTSHEFYRP
jgi:hypothetical protein